MKKTLLLIGVLGLTACGAGGEPEPPKVTATQTIGINSSSGTFTKTSIGFEFGG